VERVHLIIFITIGETTVRWLVINAMPIPISSHTAPSSTGEGAV
jgi:hypothetical protein